jgi:hypothetical protein
MTRQQSSLRVAAIVACCMRIHECSWAARTSGLKNYRHEIGIHRSQSEDEPRRTDFLRIPSGSAPVTAIEDRIRSALSASSALNRIAQKKMRRENRRDSSRRGQVVMPLFFLFAI